MANLYAEYDNGTSVQPSNCTRFQFDNTTRLALNGLFLVISIITIIGNSLIIDIYRRVKKARTSSNYCLLLLALADLIFGVSVPVLVVIYIVIKTNELTGSLIQISFYCMFTWSTLASISGLVALTYDRCIAIVWPLEYHTSVLSTSKPLVTLFVFTPAVVLGFVVPMLWHNTYDPTQCYLDWNLMTALKREYFLYILLPFFYLCSLANIVMYTVIFVYIAMLRKRISIMTNAMNAQDSNTTGEMKTLKSGLLIFGTYYLCWLPYLVVIAMPVYQPLMYKPDPTLITVTSFLALPVSLNSALNPVIYAFRVSVFREELTQMICRRGGQTESSSFASNTTPNQTDINDQQTGVAL